MLTYVASCTCGWATRRDSKRDAEITSLYHEEIHKVRPHAHTTVEHREDE